jgi:hypothetical protein
LGVDLLVIILGFLELLTLSVLIAHLSAQAVFTTAMITAKLLIGIEADHEQSIDFVFFEGLASF